MEFSTLSQALLRSIKTPKECLIVSTDSINNAKNSNIMYKWQRLVSGYYVEVCQAHSELSLSIEDMCGFMTKELTEGCIEYPTVRCGFIGEVGSSWPITGTVLFTQGMMCYYTKIHYWTNVHAWHCRIYLSIYLNDIRIPIKMYCHI